MIVNTLSGPVDTADLGFTLMHEHIIERTPGVRENWPQTFDRARAVDLAVEGLQQAAAAGVDTLVDLTTADLGREIPLVAEVASQVDVRIIVCTGLWRNPQKYFQGHSIDQAADLFVGDIEVGIQGTSFKAGIIKLASEEAAQSPMEPRLRAGARAHRRTGVPISTHTEPATRSGLDQQRIFAEEGVDLSRVVIGHSDCEDLEYLEQLLAAGSYIGIDRFGVGTTADGTAPGHLSTESRIQVIAELCRRGHASRIVLSHDASCYHDRAHPESTQLVWHHARYTYLPLDVIPALVEAGVSKDDIDQMTRRNPRAIFERTGSY